MKSFFAELKRRNMFRVGVAYAVLAWLLIQVAETLLPTFNAPQWVLQTFILLLVLGFPVAVFLAWVYELTPEGVRVASAEGPDQYHTHATGLQLNYFIIGVLVLVVAFLVVDNYVLENDARGVPVAQIVVPASPADEPVAAAQPTGPPTLAVLPFQNMSSDPEQEYFSDGLSEELLNKLAQLDGLLVAGRTSSFAFKGRNEDLRSIGEILDCGYLLEGSVRKSADTVRITAQLINAADGYHLWSATYDRELSDIFAVQDEIAEAVATALSITLGVGEAGRMEGGTRNLAAYEEILQAQHQSRTNPNLADTFRGVIAHARRAVDLDPGFVQAWLTLSQMYTREPTWVPGADAVQSRRNAEAALERARTLAPESPAVLQVIAEDRLLRREWDQAERLYRKALASSSDSDVGLQNAFTGFLLATGRASEALGYLQRIERLDPLAGNTGIGFAYGALGRFEEAFAAYERFINGQQINPTLPHALRYLGHTEALVTAWATGDEQLISEWDRRAREAGWEGINVTPGTRAEALAALKANYTGTGTGLQLHVASIQASYLGDPEFALRALRDALPIDGEGNVRFLWRPVQRDLRHLPGFKDLVSELGLVDYWRETGNWGDFCRPLGATDFECE